MSTPTVRGRLVSRDSHLRAADADREQVAEQLQTAHAEGRLDLTEFQQRLERCYETRTFGELAELVSDLPRRDGPEVRRSVRGPGPRVLTALLLLLVAFVVIGAATGAHGHHPYWLIVPVLFLLWRASWMRRRRWSAGTRGRPGGWA